MTVVDFPTAAHAATGLEHRSLFARIGRTISAFFEARERIASLNQLMDADDALLKDIGVTRADVAKEIRAPRKDKAIKASRGYDAFTATELIAEAQGRSRTWYM